MNGSREKRPLNPEVTITRSERRARQFEKLVADYGYAMRNSMGAEIGSHAIALADFMLANAKRVVFEADPLKPEKNGAAT